jgi:hypothetical protein
VALLGEQAGVELPSVDRRARVQVEQKAWVTDEITPISPPPSA